LKWTSQTGPRINGFLCCICKMGQMKIIQLGLFWLDQNCRFFVSKIDCFLVIFRTPNFTLKKSVILIQMKKSPNCVIFIWANIHLQQKKTYEFNVHFGWFTSKPLVLIRIMCVLHSILNLNLAKSKTHCRIIIIFHIAFEPNVSFHQWTSTVRSKSFRYYHMNCIKKMAKCQIHLNPQL